MSDVEIEMLQHPSSAYIALEYIQQKKQTDRQSCRGRDVQRKIERKRIDGKIETDKERDRETEKKDRDRQNGRNGEREEDKGGESV